MSNSNRGITLVALVITIIILLILGTLSANVGISTIKNMRVYSYVAKMNMIQSRVNIIKQKIENGDTSYDDIGIEITDDIKEYMQNVIEEDEDIEDFKLYNENELKEIGIEKIKMQVLINFNTRKIYSIDSIEYEGEIYYNQYNLPNGIQLIEKTNENMESPSFVIEKENYGLKTVVKVTNIEYDPQVNGSSLYYAEILDETTDPITLGNWKKANEYEFTVTKTGTYKLKLVDLAGNETVQDVNVVTCNSPELAEGMTPVVYDNDNKVWKKISNNEIGNWYDYAEGKWANIMLNDGLEFAEDGVTITEMGSMFVWIPRYAYRITSGYHPENFNGNLNIDIKFLQNTGNLTTDEISTRMINETGLNNWNVHPAFTNGSRNDYKNGGWSKEIPGIWVSKFEVSSSDPTLNYGGGDVEFNLSNIDQLYIRSVPGVSSWRNISINNMFKYAANMNKYGNVYAIKSNSNTHMLKNSEWGAIVYLTQSKYGRNGQEVTINNSSLYKTGNSADTVSGGASSNEIINDYNTDKGVLASSTGTIYGIYDLSGGASEVVAAGETTKIDEILGEINVFEERLVDRYSASSSLAGEIYVENSEKYGDAVYEISQDASGNNNAWNNDGLTIGNSFIERGRTYNDGQNAGIFAMESTTDGKLSSSSFRVAIIVE